MAKKISERNQNYSKKSSFMTSSFNKYWSFRKSQNLIYVKDFKLKYHPFTELRSLFSWKGDLIHLSLTFDLTLNTFFWMQYWHFLTSWWGRNQKTKLLFIKAKGQASFPRSKLHLRDYIVKLKSWNLNESWWNFFLFLYFKEVMGLQTNQALTKNKQTDSKYEMWNWKDSKKTIFFQYFAKVVFKVFLSVSHWVYILLDMCSLFLYVKH